MIDGYLVIIGVFIVACIAANEHWGKKGGRKQKDIQLAALLGILAIVMVLRGFNFILPGIGGTIVELSLLTVFFVFITTIDIAEKGISSIIALVAEVAVFAYIILGAFY
ncbi:MAG: hypothetical protein JXB14_01040 [Candidatus Altiarchaeota archaeon]|nr:hypothetical protein [Candidatus Altiarchaeota archaeon]